MKNLIKKRLHESLEMDLVESLVGEDYPSSFNMEEFKNLNKFTERVRYCDQHLKKISSGSSRVAYMIDNEKVLKLAKNQKGLAQNDTEIRWGGDYYFEDVLAHTLENSEKDLWVEMELARKANKAQFKAILGYTLEDLAPFLKYIDFTQRKNDRQLSAMYSRMLNNPEGDGPSYNLDFFSENEFASKLADFMIAADSPNGDLCRYSSYGVVNRDGKNQVVLIDFGLTGDVYDTYYS